jgi:outer membrane protein OmpA-like peptidoglycan-associated protein
VSPAPIAAAATAGIGAATAAAAASTRPAPDDDDGRDRGFFGFGAGTLALIGTGVLAAAVIGTLIGSSTNPPAPAPAVPLNPSAPSSGGPLAGAATPAVPQGAGVLASEVEGRPQLSVYFDTASAEVTPEFPTVAARIKTWIDANPNDRLVVSGYNDPRGDPAFNAELSKNRAQSVQAALERLGVPASAIDLEKPAETTDTTTTLENARRVDIVVRPGG